MHSRLIRLIGRTTALVTIMLMLAALMPASVTLAAPPAQDDTGSDETPPDEDVVYTVQPGDTLFKISVRFDVPMSTLIERNGIINPSHVWVGQRLIVSEAPAEAEAPAEEPAAEPIRHVVQPGEILSRIANQYGVPMSAIIAANGITNPSVLFWGTVLTIPVTAEPVTVAEAAAEEEAPAEEAAEEPPAEEPPAEAPAAEEAPVEEIVAQSAEEEAPVEEVAEEAPAEEPAAQEAVAEEAPAEEAPAEPATVPEAPTTQPYTVVAGDTLYKVALRFGTTTAYLMSINQIGNINHIEVGQTLTVPSSPTGDSPPPAVAVTGPEAPSSAGKQILVDLSEQMTYAYEDGVLLRSFLVSTGLPATPTVVGDFNVYVKYRAVRMTGPGYDLPNVPYTMYFYAGYGLHGTYWHNNFGHPMSHGCVNLRTPDAEWLYNWAPVGTPVRVVY